MSIRKHLSDFKLSMESDKIDTIIGSSVVINGPIISKKDIKIDGTVNGSVTTRGCLFLGPSSVVEGDIKAKHLTVCGKVNGNISCKGRIIISSKASISGDLSMEHLIVDEGAIFNGKANMLSGGTPDSTLHPENSNESDYSNSDYPNNDANASKE